jgi:DNA polymerase-4
MLRFGTEGERLYAMACGEEATERILRQKTFEEKTVLPNDLNDRTLLIQRVRETLDRLCHNLKSSDVQARRLTIFLKYTDDRVVRKTTVLIHPTNAFVTLSPLAVRLYGDLDRRRVSIRSIQLSATGLCGESGQMNLFETEKERKDQSLERAIVAVRSRMGFKNIIRASYLKAAIPDP